MELSFEVSFLFHAVQFTSEEFGSKEDIFLSDHFLNSHETLSELRPDRH